MLYQYNVQESEVRTVIREILQYVTIQELDETVLNRLINRILVGEVKKDRRPEDSESQDCL